MDQNTPLRENAPLCLLNPDCMLAAVRQDEKVLQHILQVLLAEDGLDVSVLDSRYYEPDLRRDCARLLASVLDGKGASYCLMLLQPDKGLTKRQIRRYIDPLLDASLFAGDEDSTQPKYYAVVLAQEDLFGDDAPRHLFALMDQDTHEVLPGSLPILYVNGAYQGDDRYGALMADLRETDPGKIQSDILRNAVSAVQEALNLDSEET